MKVHIKIWEVKFVFFLNLSTINFDKDFFLPFCFSAATNMKWIEAKMKVSCSENA